MTSVDGPVAMQIRDLAAPVIAVLGIAKVQAAPLKACRT